MKKHLDQQNDKLGGGLWARGSHDKPAETNSLQPGGELRIAKEERGEGEKRTYIGDMPVSNICLTDTSLYNMCTLSEKHGHTARRP